VVGLTSILDQGQFCGYLFYINLLLLMTLVASLIAHLMQTWFDFKLDVNDAPTDQWHNHLGAHVHEW